MYGFTSVFLYLPSPLTGWFQWASPYTAFSPSASGRSIGRVGVPTELPEVAVPRYHAPSLVQF